MTADTLNQSRARAKASPVDGVAAVPALFARLTMSSLEIAGLATKRHADVLRDIRKMLPELGYQPTQFGVGYKDAKGEARACFNLPKRETIILVSGYSTEMRARIIDRWIELEAALVAPEHDAAELLTGDNRKVIGGIVKSVVHKEITDLLPAMVEAALAADPRRSVLDYVSVRQLLDEAKALQKGRNRVNRKIGFELRERAAKEGALLRKCPHSLVWLYPRGFAVVYMADRGRSLVADHNDRIMGQGVIKFPSAKKADDVPPPAPGNSP